MTRSAHDDAVEAIHAASDDEARALEEALLVESDNRPHEGDPPQPEEQT